MSVFRTVVDAGDNVDLAIQSTNPGVHELLRKNFVFEAPGRAFNKAYRRGLWDGMIRLYRRVDEHSGLLPRGLLNDAWRVLAQGNVGELELVNEPEKPEAADFEAWVESIDKPFEPDPEQVEAAAEIVRGVRRIIVSPTSSGKTFILYLAIRYLIERGIVSKMLLIVPNISLIHQIHSNFVDEFGLDPELVHKLRGAKVAPKPITISTWQSIYKLEPEWFEQFDSVFVDEVHLATAQSIKSIMNKAVNARYRIGCTGTLRNGKINELELRGLFGPVFDVIKTHELMQRGRVAQLKICMLGFDWSAVVNEHPSYFAVKPDYQTETKLITQSKRRVLAMLKLLQEHKGKNRLVLFRFVKQGRMMYEAWQQMSDEPAFFIDGGVPGEQRVAFQQAMDAERGMVLFASLGTTSTGVSIKNIDVGVLSLMGKSKVTVLQSIGRYMRVSDTKQHALIYDCYDMIEFGADDPYNTYSCKHAMQRLELYLDSNFRVDEQLRKI